MGNTPPAGSLYPVERYLQAISDAAINSARWVVALDDDLAKRLMGREDKAVRQWKQIAGHLAFYESHKDWRAYQAFGKLALVESPLTGALLSGGVLDTMATMQTPVRPIEKAFEGAQMAVDIDPEALTALQKDALKALPRASGTLLSGPTG